MTQEDKREIINILREMKRGYNYMAGDYDFVNAIVRWAREMSSEHREMLLQTLFELMIERDELGGYTLDVFVGLGAADWAPRLEEVLPLAQGDRIWYGDLIRTLMELRYHPRLPTYLQYISNLVKKNDSRWMVYTAFLYRMDRELSLIIASAYFSRWLKSDRRMEATSKYASVIIRRYCETNCDDLIELVRRTVQQNQGAGYRLACLLKQELERPYTIQKLGDDTVKQLVDALNEYQK
jgi:hypothetical protein